MRLMTITFLISFFMSVGFASDNNLRVYLEKQTHYWGINATKADVDQLLELKEKAEAPGLTIQDRTKAYTDLFQFVQKLRGIPQGKVPGELAAGFWSEGSAPFTSDPASGKPGVFEKVSKQGTGKIPVVLIPDMGADASIFDAFMQRNKATFTFYAVTLPGFGGTLAPPPHSVIDFGKLQWWNNAETAVEHLIAKEKINRPLLIGHQAGAYLAMQTALNHPELTRGVVVLNGLLWAPVQSIPATSTVAERVHIVNGLTPTEIFPHPSKAAYLDFMMKGAIWFCKDQKRQKEIAEIMSQPDQRVWWNYFADLATTNLSEPLKNLKVPMLVVPSVYDSGLQGYEMYNKIAMDQWSPLERSKSSLPIDVVPLQDCRAYATEDCPVKLDEAVNHWISAFLR